MTMRGLRRRLLLQYLLTIAVLLACAALGLYLFTAWAEERELQTTITSEIYKVATAVELTDRAPRIDIERALQRVDPSAPLVAWQVLLPDGTQLMRSRTATPSTPNLPAPGGPDLPVEELVLENGWYDNAPVLVARLRTLRHREPVPQPARKKRPPSKTFPALPTAPKGPDQLIFDIRMIVPRGPLNEYLGQLAWYLLGGYPLALGLAALGGVWLIRRAVQPVEQAFEREQRFAWAASHELRTPLTALRGEIELALRRERSTADYLATIERVRPIIARMTNLVEGLLVLARARAGYLLRGVGEITVESLLENVQQLVAPLPRLELLQLECTVTVSGRLLGDSLLLATAIRNLVENSLRYGNDTPVTVEFSGGDRQLHIRVTDRGPGFPAALLRPGLVGAAEPGPSGQGGNGLGLAIVQAIVEAHHGQLVLSNPKKGGAQADITLPALSSLSSPGTMTSAP